MARIRLADGATETSISRLNALELFAGAGGLALGVAQAGVRRATVIDLHKPACQTLRLNKNSGVDHVRDWEILEADVREVAYQTFNRKVDILGGGPPCQPFSQGGKHKGRADSRDMFPQFIRAVRELQPRAFIAENVKGLLRSGFSGYFDYVLLQLRFPRILRRHGEKWTVHRARLERLYTGGRCKELQYNVISQVLNATDYGVPQGRERVFIVGVQSTLGLEYSFPLPTHSKASLAKSQWITGDYWDRHHIAKKNRPEPLGNMKSLLEQVRKAPDSCREHPWLTVRDAIADLPRVRSGQTATSVPNHFLNPGARAYPGHDGSALDLPAKTIKAGYHGVPGGENMVRLDSGSVRYFSVRECARLQTFPDQWAFEGAWTVCMQQLGNAVPVMLAKIVAEPLVHALMPRN